MEKLEALLVPEIQKIFLEVMQDIVDRADLDEIIAAIEANDAERLFRVTGFTPASLGPILDAIDDAYQQGAQVTANGFPKSIQTPFGMSVFRFDMRNRDVENDLRTASSTLITRLTEEARDNIRNTLQQGMIDGQNPRRTALEIIGKKDPTSKKRVGGVIGLTGQQEAAARNATRYLSTLDPRYFTLKLRDKRFDAIVTKAINSGKNLSGDDVNRIVTRYKEKALKYRGESIARTETIQSINRGAYMAQQQLVSEGFVKRSAVTKEWDDAGDGRVRSSHRALATKYNKGHGIPLDEAFVAPSGARLLFPGDISLNAPAGEIAHCRCRVKYRINWREGVE